MNSLRITRRIALQHRKNSAADATQRRCAVYHMIKRINKLPRRRMSDDVLQRLCGGA